MGSMLQNHQSLRNINSLHTGAKFRRATKPRVGGRGREFFDRAIVERHVGNHTGLPPSTKACPDRCAGRGIGPGVEAGAGAGEGPELTTGVGRPRHEWSARSARSGRESMAVSLEQARKDRPAPESAPVPASGNQGMSLPFEIQPAANPTPEKERVAKLVDP